MNILDAAGISGVVLKKVATTKGGEYTGPCPACGGTDRFHVWPADKGGSGSFWCRGCAAGGDLIQFLKDFCGYSYKDAFSAAGRSMPANYRPAGYRPAADPKEVPFEPRHYEPPVETWSIKAGELVDKSHAALLKNQKIMKYLAGRGLDEKAVRLFRLGWFEGENGKTCMFRPRTSWGLQRKANLVTGKDKMLWIPRGIVVPYVRNGLVYRVRIRRPKDDLRTDKDQKYYVIPGSGMEVFGFGGDKTTFVIVEAELDAMLIARLAGLLTGVVALGSSHVKPDARVFYHLKKALRILVALDYDDAGQTAWQWWSKNFKNARLWPVPQGKDPGEAYKKGIDIREWVAQGLPPVVTMAAVDSGYVRPKGLFPMQELKLLLTRYPIKIEADPDTAEIICDPGFKNAGIRNRVHELFFKDEEIHWYLRLKHPDKIIHGGNCEVVKEAV